MRQEVHAVGDPQHVAQVYEQADEVIKCNNSQSLHVHCRSPLSNYPALQVQVALLYKDL